MTQAVWSTAHGDFLSVTDVHGEQISRLGSHFDPILALLAPLWWLWPDPELLLVVQAVAVASGALPVFWLARKHISSADLIQAGRAGARRGVPPLAAGAMADGERLPPGGTRVPAAPLRVVAPRPGTAVGIRAAGSRGDRDERASGARRGGDRRLVRGAPPRSENRRGDCRRRRGRGAVRGARRRPALRARGHLGLREPLRVAVARRARSLVPRLPVPPAGVAPARGAARVARRATRARAEPAVEHGHPDLRQDALRSHGGPRAPRRDRLRRRAARRPLRVSRCTGRARRSRRARATRSRHDSGRRTRRRGAPRLGARARRRARQRDQHARGAPVGPPSDLQLPGAARGRLGDRRRAAADVSRQPQARAGAGPRSRHCDETRSGARVFAEDGILVFRRR